MKKEQQIIVMAALAAIIILTVLLVPKQASTTQNNETKYVEWVNVTACLCDRLDYSGCYETCRVREKAVLSGGRG